MIRKIQFERDPYGINDDEQPPKPNCPCPVCTARRLIAAKLGVPVESITGLMLFMGEPIDPPPVAPIQAPSIQTVEPGYYERQAQIAAAKAPPLPPRREGWLDRFIRWLTGAPQGEEVNHA